MRLLLFWLLKRSQQTLQVQMCLIDICTNDTCSQNQCQTCKQWSPCIPSSLLYGRSGSSNDIFSSSSVNWTSHVCNLVLLLVLLTTLPVFLPRQVSLCAYLLKIVSEPGRWGYTHALGFFPPIVPLTPSLTLSFWFCILFTLQWLLCSCLLPALCSPSAEAGGEVVCAP